MIRMLTGSEFVARRDEIVAVVIAPPPREEGVYLDDLIARIGNLRMPGDGIADDVEAGLLFFAEGLRDPWVA